MARHLQRDMEGKLRGSWRCFPVRMVFGAEPKMLAIITCPTCSSPCHMSRHTIDQNGLASPDVVCLTGCGFKDSVILDGWGTEQPIPAPGTA
jgi:hypothetical protein